MYSGRFFVRIAAAALFLLCVCATTYGRSEHPQSQNTVLLHNSPARTFWDAPSQLVSHSVSAVFHTAEEVATSIGEFPSWDRIVGVAGELFNEADAALTQLARETNVIEKVDEFKSTFHAVVATSSELGQHLSELTEKGMSPDDISKELELVFDGILEYLKSTFPPPDHAPGHEERQRMVPSVLDKTEEAILRFAREHGVSEDTEEKLRDVFERLKPLVEKLMTVTGDLVEQHPVLFNVLIFTATTLLIPESWISRPFLSVFGFGPSGPVKGSAAAWAQRRFWGAAVSKESWFSLLQRAGMKGVPIRTVVGGIGAAIGAVVGLGS